MMLVRLCNIAEIFLKDGNFSCFWVCMGGSVLSLPCTLAPRCTRRIRLAVKSTMLGLSLVASWGDHVESAACPRVQSKLVDRDREGEKSTNPSPVLVVLPHRLSLPFFPVSFFRFLFFPLVMIPCKFCE